MSAFWGWDMALRLLHRAVFENSRNSVLREICYFLDRYNAMFGASRPAGVKNPTTLDEQASLLTGIFYRIGAYLTSKPPTGGRLKRKLRWESMNDLARQITAEAARVGVKLVHSPADFRQTQKAEVNNNMWLEVLDPLHRHGGNLSKLYEKWLATAGSKSFWETIGTRARPEVEYHQGELYRVSFEAGRLVGEDGQPHSTMGKQTLFYGDGWEIFVYSPDGSLYMNSHWRSEFHHTSFTGGAAVLAAGETVVENGIVRMLTAKTGHYRTSPELMLKMVRMLREIPAEALIRPDLTDVKGRPNAEGRLKFYRVGDFRQRGLAAQPVGRDRIEATVPPWARSRQFNEDLNDHLPELQGSRPTQAKPSQDTGSNYMNPLKPAGDSSSNYMNPLNG